MATSENEELISELLKSDTGFKKTYEAHKECARKLARLEKKTLLSAEEIIEKKRLKKLKLQMKDEMQKVLSTRASAGR